MAALFPACGTDLANRSGPPKCHHSTIPFHSMCTGWGCMVQFCSLGLHLLQYKLWISMHLIIFLNSNIARLSWILSVECNSKTWPDLFSSLQVVLVAKKHCIPSLSHYPKHLNFTGMTALTVVGCCANLEIRMYLLKQNNFIDTNTGWEKAFAPPETVSGQKYHIPNIFMFSALCLTHWHSVTECGKGALSFPSLKLTKSKWVT